MNDHRDKEKDDKKKSRNSNSLEDFEDDDGREEK